MSSQGLKSQDILRTRLNHGRSNIFLFSYSFEYMVFENVSSVDVVSKNYDATKDSFANSTFLSTPYRFTIYNSTEKHENSTLPLSPSAEQRLLDYYMNEKEISSYINSVNTTLHFVRDMIDLHMYSRNLLEKNDSNEKDRFLRILYSHLSINNTIFLTYITDSYLSYFLNFYKTSILANNITNFLPIVGKLSLQRKLLRYNIPSMYLYTKHRQNRNHNMEFGSQYFIDVVNMKTITILKALSLGYNVFFSDIDVLFFENPLPYMDLHVDINIQMERYNRFKEANSGFLFAKSNNRTIQLFRNAYNYYLYRNKRQQIALNLVLFSGNITGLTVKELDSYRFPNGRDFFVLENRHFIEDLPCSSCVIMHNNWIKGIESKFYRIKELGYYSSFDPHYYVNEQEQYLYYELTDPTLSVPTQIHILKYMLHIALTLNRTLVLPSFTIPTESSAILGQYKRYRIQYLLDHFIYTTKTHTNSTLNSDLFLYPQYNYTSSFEAHASNARYNPYYIEGEMNETLHQDLLVQYKQQHPYRTVALNDVLCIHHFNQFFQEHYKEHSFFSNPHVPPSLRETFEASKVIVFSPVPPSLRSKHHYIISFISLPSL